MEFDKLGKIIEEALRGEPGESTEETPCEE